ncbi:MAG: hypothetical protein EHM58_11430 [Ignavibacteriae bacterium]|nr:MAG: hypothetical protein EHM58_11430 [Ignavibacteriota bacterium]
MRKLIPFVLLLLFVGSEYSFAGDKFGERLRLNDKSKTSIKPYFKEVEKMQRRKNAIFNLNLDIQVGADFSKADIDVNNDSLNSLETTQTKVGPTVGAILSIDFLGFGFTTGAQYSQKGIETNLTEKQNLNYINIPLLFDFNFDFGKVLIDGNLGPYFGLLISQDENTFYKVKNFDLGLTGSLQGAYLIQKYLGILLGVKYEYGGLNNLAQNININKIRTNTFYVYSGVKFFI